MQTNEWWSYYRAIEVTDRVVEAVLQLLLENGKIQFNTYFSLFEKRKVTGEDMTRLVVPSRLADAKFLTGAVDREFLLTHGIWNYYVEKFLLAQKALLTYGINRADWVTKNLLQDVQENVLQEIILFEKLNSEEKY
jgi:hypothetical protein